MVQALYYVVVVVCCVLIAAVHLHECNKWTVRYLYTWDQSKMQDFNLFWLVLMYVCVDLSRLCALSCLEFFRLEFGVLYHLLYMKLYYMCTGTCVPHMY